jgi:AraC-like DNA-binding protein
VAHLKLLWINFGTGLDAGYKLPFELLFHLTEVRPAELEPSAKSWDAICCDYDYPDMAGLRLISELKAQWPSAPIVMLTLQSSAELAIWALRSRVFDLLVKPPNSKEIDRLLERLAEVIRARRAQMERRPQATTAPLPAETRYYPQPRVDVRLEAALAYITKNFLRTVSESEVATLCNLSPSRFCREFKAAFGVTFGEYLASYRMSQAKRLLANPHMPVADVAGAVGFNDPSYFTRVFRKQEGVSPSEFRATTIFESSRLQNTASG